MLDDENRYKLFYNNSTIYSPLVSDVNGSMDIMNQAVQARTDIPFTEIGATTGALIAGGIYMFTYPIVWVDGPLPIVDAVWFAGLGLAMQRGYTIGKRAGATLDVIEDVLL